MVDPRCGESPGGLTVRGHISGKDGVYAGSLLVEMLAKSGKHLSELWDEIVALYGQLEMVEDAYPFSGSRRDALMQRIFGEHDLPEFPYATERVRWDDGCKVYFENGGWVTIRFSGTEPVLRVFCEMPTKAEAPAVSALVAQHYQLTP